MPNEFPWQAFLEAVKQKNQNRQQTMQTFADAIGSVGQDAGQALGKHQQQQAQKQFGQVFSNMNRPVQGPPTEAGSLPEQPPVDMGKLYALIGRAYPGQEGTIMPGIVKEFGRGSDSKYQEKQDKLEKDYRDELNKVVSFRSGGIGLQDAKVNQAIDLRTMINQTYDPATGQYKIPPALHSELVLGLARLVSPTGQVGVELENELKQKTAREGVASALIYLGLADPKTAGGPTQDVAKLFIDSVDRQGQTAEKIRGKYLEGLKSRYPYRLDPKRREFLDKTELTSSFDDLLKGSPDYKSASGVFQKPKDRPKANFKNPNQKATLRWNPQTNELEPVQ